MRTLVDLSRKARVYISDNTRLSLQMCCTNTRRCAFIKLHGLVAVLVLIGLASTYGIGLFLSLFNWAQDKALGRKWAYTGGMLAGLLGVLICTGVNSSLRGQVADKYAVPYVLSVIIISLLGTALSYNIASGKDRNSNDLISVVCYNVLLTLASFVLLVVGVGVYRTLQG